MATSFLPLVALVALAALAAGSPVRVPPSKSAAARSPLDLLENRTPRLAPDMADPMPPERHPNRRPAPEARAASSDPWRLPTNLIPILYQVTLEPNFKDFTFSGNNLIIVNCNEDTDKIVLNAKEIVIDASSLVVIDDRTADGWFPTKVPVKSVTYDKDHDLVTFTLSQKAVAGGRYRMSFDFTGILNDDLDGFYRSSYKTSSGETRWIATTQFEQIGARRAFPCWDEPSFKARFYIIISHDKTRNVISNMVVVKEGTTDDGTPQTQFDGTLPISSYLIAFIVSDFESVSNDDNSFRTWARHDLIKGAQVSQDVGQKALKLLGDYNGIPYALPKEDQAAIPDFAAGAMENWGLVTYREEYLIEQDSQSIRIAEYMYTTICHELGHQWTGDLVTLDWWAHTWLNEGFADYFENFICDQIKPEWHLRDKAVVSDHHRAMEYDAQETQHAMSSPTTNPDEYSAKFDRISYSKGGAVIRMWENMLGLDVLKAGMHRYLSLNIFKNTNPEDLFGAIDYVAQSANVLPAGVTFNQVARTWTEQPGVPVVTATRDYSSGAISLSQQRFFYRPPNRAGLLKQRWYIPVTIVEEGSQDWSNLKPTLVLSPTADKTSQKLKASKSQWVLLNPKEIGYYRVNYDVDNWKLLSAAVINKPDSIPSASRAQLINDALSLARGAQLDYSVALPFLNSLKAEREVAPWQSGVTALSWLRSKLAGTDAWSNFLTYLKKLTDSTYSYAKYSGSTDHEVRYLRYYVASYACYAGNADCISQANTQLKTWLANSATKLDPDTQAVSWCYGLRGADATANFNGLKAKYLAGDADTRANLLPALACANKDNLNSLLSDAVNGKLSGVSQNEVVGIWNAILDRPEQISILFDFAKTNHKLIDSYFSNSKVNAGAVTLLSACIKSFDSEEQLDNARWWVEDNYKGQAADYAQLQKAFLDAYVGLDWYRKSYSAVAAWLKTAV